MTLYMLSSCTVRFKSSVNIHALLQVSWWWERFVTFCTIMLFSPWWIAFTCRWRTSYILNNYKVSLEYELSHAFSYLTAERFIHKVNSHIRLPVARQWKCLCTFWTAEWFLSTKFWYLFKSLNVLNDFPQSEQLWASSPVWTRFTAHRGLEF